MTRTFLILGSALIALTACSATGQQYAPAKISKNEASVIVYKTQTYGNAVSFTYNDQPCKVQAQGYINLKVPPSQTLTLRHRSIGDPSPSVLTLSPRPNTTTYVRVESNDAALISGGLGGTLGGIVGGVAGQSIATSEGTFVFRNGTEAEALTTRQSKQRC